MKKEEVLKVLENCEVQSYYPITCDILAVICKDITWKEIRVLAKDIIDISEYKGHIRITIELD